MRQRQRNGTLIAAAKFIGGPFDGGVKTWHIGWMRDPVLFPIGVEIEMLGNQIDPDQYVSPGDMAHRYVKKGRAEAVSGFVIFNYEYAGIGPG